MRKSVGLLVQPRVQLRAPKLLPSKHRQKDFKTGAPETPPLSWLFDPREC